MNKPLAAVILAAGKGARMNSDLPKVLHKVGDKSMIDHVIHTSKNLGAEKIITVLGYKYNMIQQSLDDQSIECVLQEKQLGTAHAVLQCKKMLENFTGNTLILYGDVPLTKVETLSNLTSIHEKTNAWCTILTTDLPNPTGYGRIIRDKYNSLTKVVEEKDASEQERNISEVNTGIYIFNSTILFRLLPLVNNNNNQNEYYLPDVINLIIKEKGKVAIDKINNYIEIQGVNNIKQLAQANKLYGKI